MARKPFRLAAAAVTALGVATLGLGTSVAMAEEGDPAASATNKALIDSSATVNLKINKYLGMPTGQDNDGTQQTITDRAALQGVDFDVYQVADVDLTSNDGWTAATALSQYAITQADITNGYLEVDGTQYALVYQETVTTGADGQATFTKANGVGLYLVAENLATSGMITDMSTDTVLDKGLITPSTPFLVTLPMTDPNSLDQWNYTVHVYPKNQTDSAKKDVKDFETVTTDDGNVGAHGITYTITTSITDNDEPLGMYAVYDDLHEALSLTGVTVSLSNGTALDAGDYVINVNGTAWDGSEVAGGPVVQVVFTEAGLAKLEQNRDADVITVLDTLLGDLGGDDDGVVENEAYFIPNKTWSEQNPGPGIPTPEVESKYGNIKIEKKDPVNDLMLAGAVFEVYLDPTPGDQVCSAADVSGDPIASGTTGADGTYTFTGLQASNWYDGAAVTDPEDWISYCLLETKAPAGYNLEASPYYITIDWATGTVDAPAYTTAVVNNEKTNLDNELPLTGGQGIAALSILGLALIGGGTAAYAASQRKRA